MPLDYTFEPENRLLSITGVGDVSLGDRYDCVNRMMNDQGIDRKAPILIDVCHVSNSPSTAEIPSIVLLIKKLRSKFGGRIAILNTLAGHVTITNIIALDADNGFDSVQAFLSESEARAWLCADMSVYPGPPR